MSLRLVLVTCQTVAQDFLHLRSQAWYIEHPFQSSDYFVYRCVSIFWGLVQGLDEFCSHMRRHIRSCSFSQSREFYPIVSYFQRVFQFLSPLRGFLLLLLLKSRDLVSYYADLDQVRLVIPQASIRHLPEDCVVWLLVSFFSQVGSSAQSISGSVERSRSVRYFKVELGEHFGPSNLSSVEFLGCHETRQVLVIGEYFDHVWET